MTDNTKMREGKLWAFLHDSIHEAYKKLRTTGTSNEYHALLDSIAAKIADDVDARFLKAAQSEPEEKPDFEKLESLGWQIAICAMCGTHASAIKPVQAVPVVGEPVAEAYVYEDVDGDDILGLRLLKEDYPMQHGEKLYIEPTTSITRAELDALRKDAGRYRWQPIETAPKDGSAILLGLPAIGALRHEGRRVYEGRWNGEQFAFTSINGFILLDGAITWMPLPPPPISEEAAIREKK